MIAVCSTTIERTSDAARLANTLNLPLLSDPKSEAALAADYLLIYTPDYLGLHKQGEKLSSPFHIDFLSGKILYRSKQAGLRKEQLARAIGVHPRENPRIIDATAGLGRDSFILAALGYNITLLERSPILHALLADAIERARKHPAVVSIIERMHLIHADSITWLASQPQADVIYLDPMFPERKKSASVKKDMVILQDLLGKDIDSAQLLNLALTCATRRVVVKRPRLADNISQQKPNFSLTGKNSRFDIYLGTRSLR